MRQVIFPVTVLRVVSTSKLEAFQEWIEGRGRDPGTATIYVRHVRAAYAGAQPPVGRLLDRTLAPKTKRVILAALRSWARFQKDAALEERLRDLRLPPPERKTPRRPLARDDWGRLLAEIETGDWLDDPMRAVLGMMAVRGFRVGDVLRISRKEVLRAVTTGTLSFEGKGRKRLEYTARSFLSYLEMLAGITGWSQVWDLIAPGAADDKKYPAARIAVWRALKKIAVEAGVNADEVYTHRLRRTYSVAFLDEIRGQPGEAIVKLKDHMGWSDITTAAGYVDHSRREELDAVADRVAPRRKK